MTNKYENFSNEVLRALFSHKRNNCTIADTVLIRELIDILKALCPGAFSHDTSLIKLEDVGKLSIDDINVLFNSYKSVLVNRDPRSSWASTLRTMLVLSIETNERRKNFDKELDAFIKSFAVFAIPKFSLGTFIVIFGLILLAWGYAITL